MTVLRTTVQLIRCNATFKDPWNEIADPSMEAILSGPRTANHQLGVTSNKFVQIGGAGEVHTHLVSTSIVSALEFKGAERLELEFRIILECKPISSAHVDREEAKSIVRQTLQESTMEIAASIARMQLNLSEAAKLALDLASLADLGERLDDLFDSSIEEQPPTGLPHATS